MRLVHRSVSHVPVPSRKRFLLRAAVRELRDRLPQASGRYNRVRPIFHAFTAPGLYFINPCGRDAQVVTLKTTSVELASVKVADKNGNPLVMSGVVSYAVVDLDASRAGRPERARVCRRQTRTPR